MEAFEVIGKRGSPFTASLGVLHERNTVRAKRIPSFWIVYKHCLDDGEMAEHGR